MARDSRTVSHHDVPVLAEQRYYASPTPAKVKKKAPVQGAAGFVVKTADDIVTNVDAAIAANRVVVIQCATKVLARQVSTQLELKANATKDRRLLARIGVSVVRDGTEPALPPVSAPTPPPDPLPAPPPVFEKVPEPKPAIPFDPPGDPAAELAASTADSSLLDGTTPDGHRFVGVGDPERAAPAPVKSGDPVYDAMFGSGE